ncbi:hypothetical protein [Streptomyces sp. NPDC058542]|uniref:hypothetical protein n=1 Tax=Streptomyces sp. NPDC058542 TaxID=3346543 RepID=UPI00365E75FF
MRVFTDASNLTAARTGLTESSHHVAVEPGTGVAGCVEALNREPAPLEASARAGVTPGAT